MLRLCILRYPLRQDGGEGTIILIFGLCGRTDATSKEGAACPSAPAPISAASKANSMSLVIPALCGPLEWPVTRAYEFQSAPQLRPAREAHHSPTSSREKLPPTPGRGAQRWCHCCICPRICHAHQWKNRTPPSSHWSGASWEP